MTSEDAIRPAQVIKLEINFSDSLCEYEYSGYTSFFDYLKLFLKLVIWHSKNSALK